MADMRYGRVPDKCTRLAANW